MSAYWSILHDGKMYNLWKNLINDYGPAILGTLPILATVLGVRRVLVSTATELFLPFRSSTLVPVTAVSGTDGTVSEAPVYRALPVTHLKLLILQFFGLVRVEPFVVPAPTHKLPNPFATVKFDRSPHVLFNDEFILVPSI